MALDPDDLLRLEALIDARLAQRAARNRRRWLPVVLLGIVMVGAGGWWALRTGQDWLAARDTEFREAKLAYQRELAQNQAWQATREAAAKASHYDGTRTQAQHEAALMNQALGLIAEQGRLKEKWKNLDFEDPKAMETLSDDLGQILGQGLGTIGQVLLRSSDPAHNTREERIRQEASGEVLLPEKPVDLPVSKP